MAEWPMMMRASLHVPIVDRKNAVGRHCGRRSLKLLRRAIILSSGVTLLLGARASTLAAQSASDLAAWDGLMLSPVGALPPRARNNDDEKAGRNAVSLQYGRWRYDPADAIHNNIGVTLSHRIDIWNTEVALTGAYLSLSCGLCSSWASGGIDLQSTFWHRALTGSLEEGTSATFGLRTGIGGARYLGAGHATAFSVAAAAAIGVGLPFIWASRPSASVLPGFGFGRLASADVKAHGTRPSLGGALAWTFGSGFGVDVGAQRIFISGGPTQLGMGLAWNGR
ncbi:MAG: hypothetical protein NVS4B3_19610 [Gemmatimonadaceae bacterium]